LLSYRPPKLLLLVVVVLVVLAMLRRSRVSSFVLRTRGPYEQFHHGCRATRRAPAGQPHGSPGSLSQAPLRTGDALATAAGGAALCNVARDVLEIILDHSKKDRSKYAAFFVLIAGVDVCNVCERVWQHPARASPGPARNGWTQLIPWAPPRSGSSGRDTPLIGRARWFNPCALRKDVAKLRCWKCRYQ